MRWLMAAMFVTLTGPDGQVIQLAPDKVATIRTPRGEVTKSAHCLIFTTDTKNISVKQTCDEVRRLLEQSK